MKSFVNWEKSGWECGQYVRFSVFVPCVSQMSRRRDRNTGLNTLKYTVVSDIEMTVAGAPLHFVSVELECDYNLTPFCDAPS